MTGSYVLNGGTILQGDGTFPAFYTVGDATGSTAQATLGDLTAPPLVSNTFTNGWKLGIGVSDMALYNFSYGIKVGALWNAGCAHSMRMP